MTYERITHGMLIVVVLSVLAGCASPSQPTRFYRLDGEPRGAELVDLKPLPGITLIGISTVELAGYLDRPQIVERRSPHRLELYEFDQWAGSLQENLRLLMTDRLQQQLESMRVIAYPWHQSVMPDFELHLYISRFDVEGEQIRLQARWSLIERSDNRLVAMQRMTVLEPSSGDGVEAGVSAANRAVSKLAVQIASRISSGVSGP